MIALQECEEEYCTFWCKRGEIVYINNTLGALMLSVEYLVYHGVRNGSNLSASFYLPHISFVFLFCIYFNLMVSVSYVNKS